MHEPLYDVPAWQQLAWSQYNHDNHIERDMPECEYPNV